MRKWISYSLTGLLAVLCCACNSDIFVEPAPDIEENIYYLKCDGEAVTFTIPTKGLQGVRFDCDHPTLAGVDCFDKNGEYLYNFNWEDVSKVVFASPLFCIEFEVDGDRITAYALDNTTTERIEIWVGLDYEYTSRYIDFEINPGKPLEIAHLGYDIMNPISGIATERGIPHTFNNNSDRTQRMVIYPYKEANSKIKLSMEEYEWWAKGTEGTVQIPFYSDGEWHDSDTNIAEVRIGDVTQFYSPDLDSEEKYTLEVAPYSKVTTITTMTYATLDVTYVAELRQPGSGSTFYLTGKCQLRQPISYNIEQQ